MVCKDYHHPPYQPLTTSPVAIRPRSNFISQGCFLGPSDTLSFPGLALKAEPEISILIYLGGDPREQTLRDQRKSENSTPACTVELGTSMGNWGLIPLEPSEEQENVPQNCLLEDLSVGFPP